VLEKVEHMKKLETIPLRTGEKQALIIVRERLEKFGVSSVILYGSTARGEAEPESDTDLLILTAKPMSRLERRHITDEIFEINLNYRTNFSGLVVDTEAWEKGPISLLPIKNEILRDGVILSI
jgi:predicted nucleotidyltransferase